MQNIDYEELIFQETIQHGGRLKLDFKNPSHYQFYVNRLGGEGRLGKDSPKLLQILQRWRAVQTPHKDSSDVYTGFIHLEDTARVENPQINRIPASSKDEFSFTAQITSTLGTSYGAGNVCMVTADVRVLDTDTKQCISRNNYVIEPDEHGEFIQNVQINLPSEQYNLGHAYRFSSLFTEYIPDENDDVTLGATNVVSTIFTEGVTDYIQKMTLHHPIIRYPQGRDDNLKDYICISYQRDQQIKSPDYSYRVSVPHDVDSIPVHLPFSLTIELDPGKNASFTSVNNSFFDAQWAPQIYLKNFDNAKKVPISAGAATFYADWEQFSVDNVEVTPAPGTQNLCTLRLFFQHKADPPQYITDEKQDQWLSNLNAPIPKELWSYSTYAVFYMNIALNLAIKTGTGIARSTLPVIIQFLAGKTPGNVTGKGENTMYIPAIYYQWGCLARDTMIETERGQVPADQIQIGDSVLTREGSFAMVRDIITGPEQELLTLHLDNHGSIRLTKDHTLCYESGRPVAAGNLRPGDRIQIFLTDTRELAAAAVTGCSLEPYNNTVYNFSFAEPTFLIAQGIVAGDDKYQQLVRLAEPTPYKNAQPNEAVRAISRDIVKLLTPAPYPDFIPSNEPLYSNLYYYAVKALARSSGLYSEEEAQEIAEYCGFLESNATYGGVSVPNINEKINSRKLSLLSDSGYYVKLIPTAMNQWYNDAELDQVKSWQCPGAISPEDSFTYRTIDDILVPFHYPVDREKKPGSKGNPPLVTFNPAFIQDKLLGEILNHAKGAEPIQDAYLHMGMGMSFHLMIDSALHEFYTGTRYWQNLRRVQDAHDYQQMNLKTAYGPYKNYPYEPYSPAASYPAGIQQTGAVAELPSAMYSYLYPTSTAEITDEDETLCYNGYNTRMNDSRILAILHEIQSFLYRFKGKKLEPLNWRSQYEISLKTIFETTYLNMNEWNHAWKAQFSTVTFSYDARQVYERLVTGIKDESEGTRSYEDLFQFILMLNQIQTGGKLYD